MLVKCESKSSRVKAICFHNNLPWVLVGLHTGTIQLWDYKRACILYKFEGHIGPVRALHFHATQSLFCSGADDREIHVWDYDRRALLFKLSGHVDYIRSVEFHNEYPWILSGCDDQTIRIWNWQSRQCISVLAGHHHFVMCARFHPNFDIIASCSMDQTIRLWDITGLKERNVARLHNLHDSYGAQDFFQEHHRGGSSAMSPAVPGPQASVAATGGGQEVLCKYIIEGHTRGVNWIDFHPTMNMLISGSDDRTIKLFRFDDTRWWEIDTLKGHFNNISSVKFHPVLDLILSNSEDHSIRIWDLNTRKLINTVRRENDRFWVMDCVHNTIAAGHDSGMIIFKLMRERPAVWPLSTEPQLRLLCARNNNLRIIGEDKKADSIVAHDIRQHLGSHSSTSANSSNTSWQPYYPVEIIRNTINKIGVTIAILYSPTNCTGSSSGVSGGGISSSGSADDHSFDILHCPDKECDLFQHVVTNQSCSSLQFFGRNQYVTLSKYGILETHTIGRDESKVITVPPYEDADSYEEGGSEDALSPRISTTGHMIIPEKLFFGGINRVMFRASDGPIYMFDLKNSKFISKLDLSLAGAHCAKGRVRYCVWHDKKVVLLSKKYLTVARDENGSGSLVHVFSIHECSRLKSAIWLDSNLILYTTSSHLKYLTFGDESTTRGCSGVVLSLHQNACGNSYLQAAHPVSECLYNVYYMNNQQELQVMRNVNLCEPFLKLAIQRKDQLKIQNLLSSHKPPGWSWIQYLQANNFPQIAYAYVDDPRFKIKLALRFGDLDCAYSHMIKLPVDENVPWEELGNLAVKYGRLDLAITAFQKSRKYAALINIFSITGDTTRLQKFTQIIQRLGNDNLTLQACLFSGDVEQRITLLLAQKRNALAYLTAKSHGLKTQLETIKPLLTEQVINRLDRSLAEVSNKKLLAPPLPVYLSEDLQVWPMASKPNILEDAPLSPEATKFAPSKAKTPVQSANLRSLEFADDGGWLEEDDDELFADKDVISSEALATHETCDATDQARATSVSLMQPGKTVASDPIHEVGDLAALGDFVGAANLLSDTIADIRPLKPLLRAQYIAAQSMLPSLPLLGYIPIYLERDNRVHRLCNTDTFNKHFKAGLQSFTKEGMGKCMELMRSCVLQACLITPPKELTDVWQHYKKDIAVAGQYIAAVRILQAAESSETPANQLQLHCLATRLDLLPNHRFQLYRLACSVAKQHNNNMTRAKLIRSLAKCNLEQQAPDLMEKVAAMKTRQLTEAERLGNEAIQGIEVDRPICCMCMTVMPQDCPEGQVFGCAHCGCTACHRLDAKVCAICELLESHNTMAVDCFMTYDDPPPASLIPPEFRLSADDSPVSVLFHWLPGELTSRNSSEKRNVFPIMSDPPSHRIIDISDSDYQYSEEGELSSSISHSSSDSGSRGRGGSRRRRRNSPSPVGRSRRRRSRSYTSSDSPSRSPVRRGRRPGRSPSYYSDSISRSRSADARPPKRNGGRGAEAPRGREINTRPKAYRSPSRSQSDSWSDNVSGNTAHRPSATGRLPPSARPPPQNNLPRTQSLARPHEPPKTPAELKKLKLAAELGINRGTGTHADAERDRKRKDEEYKKSLEAKQIISDDIMRKREEAKARQVLRPPPPPANNRGRRGRR